VAARILPACTDYDGNGSLKAKNVGEFATNPLQFAAPTIIVGEWPVSPEEAHLDQCFVF
jgi:hypothetical protein